MADVEELEIRLENANTHFRNKAAEVLGNPPSVKFLADLYQGGVMNILDVEWGRDGLFVARLTAANFCEIGALVIFITPAGQRFVEWLEGV